MPWAGCSGARHWHRSFVVARRAVRENCKRSGSSLDRVARTARPRIPGTRHDVANLQPASCQTERGKSRADGASSRCAPRNGRAETPRAIGLAWRPSSRACPENANSLDPTKVACGKSRSHPCGGSANRDTIPQVKTRHPTSSALSNRMGSPVPFNGPISCRERTRGIYRLQGVAAGYGACVRRLRLLMVNWSTA